jgi:TPR repeat protein
VTADFTKAVAWAEKGALADSADAQNDLGLALQLGKGVAKNEANAARMFRLAAQQSLPEAEYNLAVMYDLGAGLPQDYAQARHWYERAADDNEGDGDAEYRLGILDEQGLGDAKNPSGATSWFDKAAEHGSVNAALRLAFTPPAGVPSLRREKYLHLAGEGLAYGVGVPRDERRGFAYVKEAAEKNWEPAMFTLAIMYDSGRGTPKNEAKALETYDQLIAVNNKHQMAYNNFAWICVTAQDPKVRNPQKALPYALKAVELSKGRDPAELDTLARVYFMLGDPDKAIDFQKKAIALAPDKENYQKALEEYQSAKNHPRAAK